MSIRASKVWLWMLSPHTLMKTKGITAQLRAEIPYQSKKPS